MTAGGAGEAALIDCHAHAWGPGMPFAPNAWMRPDYVYSAEDFIDTWMPMDCATA